MCIRDRSGIDNINEQLFSEESGFVIQIKKDDSNSIIESLHEKGLMIKEIANIEDKNFTIVKEEAELFNEPIIELEKIWRETSHAIQGIRDNIEVADSELSLLDEEGFSGLIANTSFDESQIKSLNICLLYTSPSPRD